MKNLLFIFLLCCLNETLFAQIQQVWEYETRDELYYKGKIKSVIETEIDVRTNKSKLKNELHFNKEGYLVQEKHEYINDDESKSYFLNFDFLNRPTLIKRYLRSYPFEPIKYEFDSLSIEYDDKNNVRIEKIITKNKIVYIDTLEINSKKHFDTNVKYFINIKNLDSLSKCYSTSQIKNYIKTKQNEAYYLKEASSSKWKLEKKKVFDNQNRLKYITESDSGIVSTFDTLGRMTLFRFIDINDSSNIENSSLINKYQKIIYHLNGKIIIKHKYGNTSRIDSICFDNKNKLVKMKSVDCPPHDWGLIFLAKDSISWQYRQYHLLEYYDVFLNQYNEKETHLNNIAGDKIVITQTFDYDSKESWIISKLYGDNKLVKIYKREISYWE